ncbi:MAG: SRPBCC domain-containing protein [Gemmataceae bacterium]
MIHFTGERRFALPVGELFSKLSDAAFLVGCLPDAKVAESSADRVAWKLKPKLSFLTGGLDAVIEVVGREPGRTATFRIVSKAIGASSTVAAVLQFLATESGTLVNWAGDLLEVTGLLKMVPKGLLQGTAEKVIEDTWQAIEAKLTPSSPTP